jgi:G3E family GTPase
MIPLCLVTGFLGAGKTTLLERMIEQLQGRRIVYLVNEFSPKDIDGSRLQLPDNQLTTVAGGSIFCRCKVTEFIDALEHLIELQPDGVVIETSGMADPSGFATMLAETRLDRHFRLARGVCLIDPGQFPKLLRTLPATVKQVQAADLLLINKIDKYTDTTIETCQLQLETLQPMAEIVRCSQAQHQADWLPAAGRAPAIAGELTPCKDISFVTEQVQPAANITIEQLADACRAISPALHRVKGCLAGPDGCGCWQVDYSAGVWQQRACQQQDANLVLIADLTAEDALHQLAQNLANGHLANPTA